MNLMKYKTYLFFAISLFFIISAFSYIGYIKGYDSADDKWKEIQAKSEIEYNNELTKLKGELLISQTETMAKQLLITANYQKEINDAEIKSKDIIDKLNNDNLRLSITVNKTKNSTTGATSCEDTAGVNGAYRAELSREASRFLIDLTHEADVAARRLNALQKATRELESYAENCKVILTQ